MSIVRHHNEWLSLVPNSGPFLSLPVLKDAFRQGLDAHDTDHARRLRVAYQEWDEDQTGRRPDPVIHQAWVKLVLGETLGFAELLAEKQAIPETLKSEIGEYGETLRPDWVVNDPVTKKVRLLVQFYPRSQALGKPVASSRWKTSPDTRMMQLLHDTGVRLGIVTNGDHWMLVNAPKNETTGYASWYANLWLEESITLRAFRTLLSADRLFSVPQNETLEALLDKSASDQQEVTDQLGYQVRKAVEVLIQALDKADQDHGRKLLAGLSEKVLYESALTVMMRLVFLFCAEERDLLLLGDELYDRNYAVSTLREQLRATADQFGEEILGLRHDAWVRMLTSFRVVYAGAKHDRIKLPAYGGSLFHPDRFTFLEGRAAGTSWKDTAATPLPVSNRTVLHLLEALQVLQVRLPGGGPPEARRLSFRELNIEQIGHVYEGLLDHTAKRATEPMLGLKGTRDKEPEIALAELEALFAKGEKELLKHLRDATDRSESALKKELHADIDGDRVTRFRTACEGDELWKRVKPFAGLVRLDTVGYPVVITTGSVFVTTGTDRRSSGTHYTPKSLTEPIVRYTLEPLVYVGPSEGSPKEQWKLRPAKELLALKICDVACGSGAFLVQSCRYLAERLLESWGQDEDLAQRRHQPNLFDSEPKPRHDIVRITPYGQPSQGGLFEQLVPLDPNERYTYALRIVAQRCLYGVDKNPLAVEMAKLSLWLLTLAKNMPFEFLDHAIRCGDSLVGIHSLAQVRKFALQPDVPNTFDFPGEFDGPVDQALHFRQEITGTQANTVEEVEEQARLLQEANEKIDKLKCVADLLVGAEFLNWQQRELLEDELRDESQDEGNEPGWLKAKKMTEAFRKAARTKAASEVTTHFNDSDLSTFRGECSQWLNGQPTFHWPLEFPEVFAERGGFDAIVGNPPFMGGKKITGNLNDEYREYLVRWLANGKRGSADLCAYFFIRGIQLLGSGGQLGSLATNTIAQGDTREIGLDQLLAGSCVIPRAVRSQPWPGKANLEIALVWVRKGKWASLFVLDGQPAEGITAFLTAPSTVTGNPCRLKANECKSFQGSIVLGKGFILPTEDAAALIAKDARNKDVLFPYLNGEDLNNRPDQSPSRWVINFFDWPIERAKEYKDCFAIIEQKVKPERTRPGDKDGYALRKPLPQKWWIYADKRPELYQTIKEMSQVLVVGAVSPTTAFHFVENGFVYAHKLNAFTLPDEADLALLQSTIHREWAYQYSSTFGATTLNYSPRSCFTTALRESRYTRA